ncbi:retrovirus-related pol polyprotein from transposon TNT 1-94 [Tanacetum coccineum]
MATNEETNAAGTDTRPPMLVENNYESWKIIHRENKLEMTDTFPKAEIILSQGLPRHIFNNLNQTSTAKEIWENVEMLMQGSGRTIQQRKEDLTWISTTPYVQIYTQSKSLRAHAKMSLKKQELSKIANLYGGFQKQFPPTNNQLWTSSNSRTHATVHDGQIVTEPIQRKAPGNVGNTGARGKKVICYNCRGEGHVARQCKEPKRKMDSQYFKDKALLMQLKERRCVRCLEAEGILADVGLTRTL